MHLLALVESPDHVCSRYRLAAFRSHLERAGHSLELRSWSNLWPWSSSLAQADAVILQRKLIAPWQLFLLRRQARRLIFDFDDAIYLRDSYSPKGLTSRRRQGRFAAIVAAADAVAAGNAFLARRAAAAGARAVQVIPTCVEPAHYLPSHADQQPVELVWVGSSSTLKGLEQVRSMLEAIGRGVPNLCLKLICDRFLELHSLPVKPCPWSEASEAREIASAHIGISWMPDDDWSRGKCGLKVLQYQAAGLPVVANPVGVHPEMVRDGATGYLANTAEEWCSAIARLASDAALRRRLGQNGRRQVEAQYSVSEGAARWIGLLDQLQKGQAAA